MYNQLMNQVNFIEHFLCSQVLHKMLFIGWKQKDRNSVSRETDIKFDQTNRINRF